jgi:hypothetical protein
VIQTALKKVIQRANLKKVIQNRVWDRRAFLITSLFLKVIQPHDSE